MANSSHASGSQAATLDTDHTLATIAAAGTYVLKVDAGALQNGEALILAVWGTARTGDTLRLMYEAAYLHEQGDALKVSLPIPTAGEDVAFVLRQEGGTGRTFPWNIIRLG
jgi:hypothetical protein